MQEEIEQKTINLAVSVAKLTGRNVLKGVEKLLAESAKGGRQGRQTVRQLIGDGQGVQSIDIAKTGLSGLQRHLRRYGIQHAIVKDGGSEPPLYHVFFKARDADAMTACFKDYAAELARREKSPRRPLREAVRLARDRQAERGGGERDRVRNKQPDLGR